MGCYGCNLGYVLLLQQNVNREPGLEVKNWKGQSGTLFPVLIQGYSTKESSVHEWMKEICISVLLVTYQQQCWLKKLQTLFTVYYCWPSLCSWSTHSQIPASSNMIDRNKYEAKERETLHPHSSVFCHQTLDINLMCDLWDYYGGDKNI